MVLTATFLVMLLFFGGCRVISGLAWCLRDFHFCEIVGAGMHLVCKAFMI